MNKQFSNSFNHLVESDVNKLEKIVCDYTSTILEATREDE